MKMKKTSESETLNSKIHMRVRKNACSQNCYTSCISFNIWKLSSNKMKFSRRCTKMLTAADPKTKFGENNGNEETSKTSNSEKEKEKRKKMKEEGLMDYFFCLT